MWSKIKSNVENKFADVLKGKVQIYITSYGSDYDIIDYYNRGWITVNGEEVVNFSTPDFFQLNRCFYHYATPTDCMQAEKLIEPTKINNSLLAKCEFSKYDLSHCCYAFLDMSIDESFNHESPIIKMLSVLDKRLGKRRLMKLNEKQDLHPLVRYFLDLRLEMENMKLIN